MTKKDFAWLFAVVLLFIALVLCVVLGMRGYFSSVAYLKSETDITVGDTVIIPVESNQTAVVSCSFDGAYFPGESIPQVVQISAINCDNDVRIRIKTLVTGKDENFTFVTSEHFSLEEDGYYYYDDVLEVGTKVTFCTEAIMPESGDFISGEKYILTYVVEVLQPDFADQIWNF